MSQRKTPRSDPLDLSQLSLAGRAKLTALIEVDGDDALRQHLLGAIGRREASSRPSASRDRVPDRWSQVYVLDRLEEAFEVMAMMPATTRPKSFGTAWPKYAYDRFDLNAQMETEELEKTLADRNKVRLSPTAAQVTRMEQALRWPFEYLIARPELAKAISLKALWSCTKVDIRKRCAVRGIDHAVFNARWQEGLAVITGTLLARKVPVS